MSKSYEELLDYSKKIIERGDGWRALKAYLDKNCNNLQWREEILQKVREFENTFEKKGHLRQKAERTNYDIILGVGGITFGLILLCLCFFAFDAGIIVATIPFAFIGLGIRQLLNK